MSYKMSTYIADFGYLIETISSTDGYNPHIIEDSSTFNSLVQDYSYWKNIK